MLSKNHLWQAKRKLDEIYMAGVSYWLSDLRFSRKITNAKKRCPCHRWATSILRTHRNMSSTQSNPNLQVLVNTITLISLEHTDVLSLSLGCARALCHRLHSKRSIIFRKWVLILQMKRQVKEAHGFGFILSFLNKPGTEIPAQQECFPSMFLPQKPASTRCMVSKINKNRKIWTGFSQTHHQKWSSAGFIHYKYIQCSEGNLQKEQKDLITSKVSWATSYVKAFLGLRTWIIAIAVVPTLTEQPAISHGQSISFINFLLILDSKKNIYWPMTHDIPAASKIELA